jgi:hypothetical protein
MSPLQALIHGLPQCSAPSDNKTNLHTSLLRFVNYCCQYDSRQAGRLESTRLAVTEQALRVKQVACQDHQPASHITTNNVL